MNPNRHSGLGKEPSWFKWWGVFCALVSFGMLALIVWAVVSLVTWVTSK